VRSARSAEERKQKPDAVGADAGQPGPTTRRAEGGAATG
jgi:hypothetical protein